MALVAQTKRLFSLDILRAIFLSMAMWQYYGYFSDNWYVDFSPHPGASPFPIIEGGRALSNIFTPWVSQAYVFLACVNLNLSMRTPLWQRRRKWLLYAGFILVEALLVWPKWGEKLTPPAVVLGIATMLVVSSIGARWGWKGVVAGLLAFCFAYDSWLIPFGDELEFFVQNALAFPDWEYNARLEYFVGTGFIGYLVGFCLIDRTPRKMLLLMGAALVAGIPWLLWGNRYYLPAFDVFANEYSLSRELLDLSGLWSLIVLVTCTSVLIEMKNVNLIWARPLIWISLHTWTIFAVHRLIYVFGYGPILEKLADQGVVPRQLSLALIIALSYLTCVLVWLSLKMISKINRVNLIYTVRAKLESKRGN